MGKKAAGRMDERVKMGREATGRWEGRPREDGKGGRGKMGRKAAGRWQRRPREDGEAAGRMEDDGKSNNARKRPREEQESKKARKRPDLEIILIFSAEPGSGKSPIFSFSAPTPERLRTGGFLICSVLLFATTWTRGLLAAGRWEGRPWAFFWSPAAPDPAWPKDSASRLLQKGARNR